MRRTGFTLLEVLVALAIFAITATMVHAALQRHARNAQVLESRLLAGWLAENMIAEARLAGPPAAAVDLAERRGFAGRQWQATRVARATRQPGLWLLEVHVAEADLHAVDGAGAGVRRTAVLGPVP